MELELKNTSTWGVQAVMNDRSKSANTMCPSFMSSIFSGFRSRYTIPVYGAYILILNETARMIGGKDYSRRVAKCINKKCLD